MSEQLSRLSLSAVKNSLPPPCPLRLESIRDKSASLNRTVVILDDDPTGNQTVYGAPILTEWSQESIEREFRNQTPFFFLLTNSRSVPSEQAATMAHQIGEVLRVASKKTGQSFEVISRSDSTLRGHYPTEVTPLAEAINQADAPVILCPFFLEGNRLTYEDTHYVVDGDEMIPAAQTPFADDTAFGFENSNLRDWILEKTDGQIEQDKIVSLSIETLRTSTDAIKKTLQELQPGYVCIVNSLELSDLCVFVDVLLECCLEGREYLYRTAASFVQARMGLPTKPLLTQSDLIKNRMTGGLVVVGSYVPKTTRQFAKLQETLLKIQCIEIDVSELDSEDKRNEIIINTSQRVNEAIFKGLNLVIYTSRKYQGTGNPDLDLKNGKRVSETLVEIVSNLDAPPAFLIAKGGITSSDLATKALGVKRAIVAGQILPGVPVWQLQSESRFPQMPFIVFPGNVGDDDALRTAYAKLNPNN